MNDRGMVKWAPFNAVINGSMALHEIMEEKNKIPRPILSDEQINLLENKIIEAYKSSTSITIKHYNREHIISTNGVIAKIDNISKTIILKDKTKIYFYNIINILEKNT